VSHMSLAAKVRLAERMANRAGRAKRPVGEGRAAIKATVRLAPQSLEVAETAAAALGVSRDAYLDHLLARERERLDERGRPVWWTGPVPRDQEELPLKSA